MNKNRRGINPVASIRTSLLLLISLAILCSAGSGHASSAIKTLNSLDSAALLMTDAHGNAMLGKSPSQPMIPASTTKLVSAWLAIEHWGEEHRFGTPFYLDRASGTLWIKAAGDPFLVSEELQLIADKIASRKPGRIARIALDVSLFKPDLVVPGAGVSNNPYDAVPTAIASNFNTLHLKKTANTIESAEPQTPLTRFSRSFDSAITGDSLRINTGRQSSQAERYFAELLAALLRERSVDVSDAIVWGDFPADQTDFVHHNSRTLGEIVQLMLKYSTNFIANQLMLTLVAEVYRQPADFSLVSQYMSTRLKQNFNWNNFSLFEGAGLSPDNRLSPRQLIDLLRSFKTWSHLLPEVAPGIFAKTGSLTDVSTLAGYLKPAGEPVRLFAIMVNQAVPRDFVLTVAMELSGS